MPVAKRSRWSPLISEIELDMELEITPSSAVAELKAGGFAFAPLPNVLGYVDGFHANRFGIDYVDSVVVRGEEFAHAARVRNDFRIDDPLHEPDVLWFEIGELKEVMEALRELYQPREVPPPNAWPGGGGRHRLINEGGDEDEAP